jgi:hypothetical protein
MKLAEAALSKADPVLRRALVNAADTDVLRALVTFYENGNHQDARPSDERPVRSNFESDSEFRKALLDWNDNEFHRRHQKAVETLTKLKLNPVELPATGTVIVEGSAKNIANALRIPGVQRLILDRPIEIERPPRRASNGKGRHRK